MWVREKVPGSMRLGGIFASFLALVPAIASAAEPAPPEPSRVDTVERGLFVESDIGLSVIVNRVDDRSFGAGVVTGIFIGYDLAPFFALSLGGQMLAASGDDDAPAPTGDLVWLMPMLNAQIAIVTTERDYVWARVGGGYAFAVPSQVDGQPFGDDGPAFSATLAYERFTKLRHFSIGAQAGVLVVTAPGLGIGVSLIPTLKYTF